MLSFIKRIFKAFQPTPNTPVATISPYNEYREKFPEIQEWTDYKMKGEMKLLLNMKYILQLSERHNWTKIFGNKNPLMLSFMKNDMRINVYPTTMTVATALKHPFKGKTQLYRKGVSLATLNSIFVDPRTHTNQGYYTKKKL
jgi:hypothetical protein